LPLGTDSGHSEVAACPACLRHYRRDGREVREVAGAA
jgi:hypothetical protein